MFICCSTKEIPSYVSIFRIHGPFLFGATDKLNAVVSRLSDLPPIIILRLRNMTAIDSTGLQALENLSATSVRLAGDLFFVGHKNSPPRDCERLKSTTISDQRIFAAVWPRLWIGRNPCAWRSRSTPRYCSP